MAEGIANSILSKDIIIKSAGTEAHGVNPMAIEVMNDISISISRHKSKKINNDDLEGFNLIITLCGDVRDKCPVISSKTKHIHWGIDDPANFKGNQEEVKKKYSIVRDIIFDNIIKLKSELRNI